MTLDCVQTRALLGALAVHLSEHRPEYVSRLNTWLVLGFVG